MVIHIRFADPGEYELELTHEMTVCISTNYMHLVRHASCQNLE